MRGGGANAGLIRFLVGDYKGNRNTIYIEEPHFTLGIVRQNRWTSFPAK